MSSLSSNPRSLSPLASETFLSLAPLHLINFRQVRYQGDDLCISKYQLAERDQTLLTHLYQVLNELLYTISDTTTDDAGKWRDATRWTQRHSLDGLIDDVRELGRVSQERTPSEGLSKAMHDLRGGALSSLLGRLQLLDVLPQTEVELKTLFILTRDHLKIMRNVITELDEPRRNADRTPKSHDAGLLVSKWHDSVVGPKWRERPVRLSVDCRYEGALTECCLESAAIDRIFYNLANNACRHAVGDQIAMVIFPIPEPPGTCLRFVLSNEVSEAHAEYLRSLARADGGHDEDRRGRRYLPTLFQPTVSTTGSGYGLTVVAEFVTGAFGLHDPGEALRERYVGALIEDRTFRVWLHWPIASSAHPHKTDDYHHPAESLSEG